MSSKRDFKGEGLTELVMLIAQGDLCAKTEFARRMLKGDGVDKNEAKAVSLLEDCVAHGDADAMLMLAKCCALGCGIKYDAKRAEVLMSEAAKKGNDEALILMKLINDWKGEETVDLGGLLPCFLSRLTGKIHDCVVFIVDFEGEWTVERVAVVMNIIPCRDLSFGG